LLAGRTITVAWSFLVVSPLDPLAGAEDKLRDIRSVTDAALWYLGADDLLAELLARVKEILDADTVAVLLLDSSGRQLVATAASGLSTGSPWMPGPIRPVLTRALPLVLRGAATGYRAMLVERGRRVAGDLSFLSTRFVGFGDPRVHPAVVDFLEQMIRSTPIEVVAAFGEVLYGVDMRDTLATLGRVPVVTVTGDKDRLISPSLGLELAEAIPSAELVWVPGAGHAVILEAPGVVNEAITGLIARVGAGAAAREWSA